MATVWLVAFTLKHNFSHVSEHHFALILSSKTNILLDQPALCTSPLSNTTCQVIVIMDQQKQWIGSQLASWVVNTRGLSMLLWLIFGWSSSWELCMCWQYTRDLASLTWQRITLKRHLPNRGKQAPSLGTKLSSTERFRSFVSSLQAFTMKSHMTPWKSSFYRILIHLSAEEY